MHSTRLGTVALLLAALFVPAAVFADVIYLKDGFVLQGTIMREGEKIIDRDADDVVFVANGFMYVNDGARRIIFSPKQVQDLSKEPLPKQDVLLFKKHILVRTPRRTPALRGIVSAEDWDEKWDRKLKLQSTTYQFDLEQHLSFLAPTWARADSSRLYGWSMFLTPQEMGASTVLKLLQTHPDLMPTDKDSDARKAEKRIRLLEFLLAAGFADTAEAELKQALKDLPSQKEALEVFRTRLRGWQNRHLLEEVLKARSVGRHVWAAQNIKRIEEKYLSAKLVGELTTLRNTLDTEAEKIKAAKDFLASLPARLKAGNTSRLLAEAARALSEELNPDVIGRLETFLKQAEQAVRKEKAGQKASLTPDEILALAITGWLMGDSGAQPLPATAEALWKARDFLLRHWKDDDAENRKTLRNTYSTERDAISVKELAQLVRELPPPLPAPVGPNAVEHKVDNVSYQVLMPHEYRHSRAYPTLIVLHDAGEMPRDMIRRWQKQAQEAGFLLLAPKWQRPRTVGYEYTEEEHEAVIKALRDACRRYHIDTDRVLLFGLGEGGKMAYDVGLAHPDLFAGIMPMGGWPEYFARVYRTNAQHLPIYNVLGNCSGDPTKITREQFMKWVPPGYPVLWVEYKGRGAEWFEGEMAPMLDWAARKKRAAPLTVLGAFDSEEFCSMRPGDNSFYWVSGEISQRHHNNAAVWNARVFPAKMYARVNVAQNNVYVHTRGYTAVTVWLSLDSKLDFEKPISIYSNGSVRAANRKFTPSLAVMLEDLHQRGDRKKLFIARLDFKP